ncbi:MAG: hypothetical protein P4K94_12005 [Terracidiphilus sp.]|jgi:hypothetical protein|nr:hypothetical protein [Terracidiphilus sp.]
MTHELTLDEYQRMMEERIIARRVTLDEFSDYIGGLDYIYGRILTKSGIELFVGVKEFAETIRVSDEEKENERGAASDRYRQADRKAKK